MYAKIRMNISLDYTLNYHRRKLKQDVAECIDARNMLKDAEDLSAKEKRYFLQRLQTLNDRVEKKTVHIFLNWHESDVLDNEKMRKISREYMEKMGLEKQPYLVYRHWDMPHPHAHIVSTNIRKDGTRIELWKREFLRSMKLTRELEQKYGLYRAGVRQPDEEWKRKHPAQKVVYGQTPLKPTINSVLEQVLPHYRYTSLEELNVILRAYNLRATRGREETVTFRNNGLLYFPLKASGEKEDVYIKSSTLRCRPTLRKLQEHFVRNRPAYEENRQRLTASIDWVFFKQRVSMEAFQKALSKERVKVVENSGRLFYIDEGQKAVYDGERLGRKYSAEGIAERCIPAEVYRQEQTLKQQQKLQLRQRPRLDLY